MFNGNIPIILDSLKQHYFIDRDGKIFRHILNYLRTQKLLLPAGFADWDVLLEEVRFYDITPMITDLEKARDKGQQRNGYSQGHSKVRIKVEDSAAADDCVDCILVHISPDLGERISLSADKAGIGSAVNDTTRELGGTLGVAIIGSVFSSVYIAALEDDPVIAALPDDARHATEESVGAAQFVAPQLGDAAPTYLASVNEAFLSGLSTACIVAACAALAGSAFAARFLPARA